MSTLIQPSNVSDNTYIITANNALHLNGVAANQYYSDARVTITDTVPGDVGATANGHMWLVYNP